MTHHAVLPAPADPTPPHRDAGWRILVRGLGQLLITVGVVLLLFVVYEVWVSNLFADAKQASVRHKFDQAIAAGKDPLGSADTVQADGRVPLPVGKQVVLPGGAGFANLYIPRFGKDYVRTIVEGSDDADLDRGPGHYIGTALPGQVGNFAVAGHRVGKGEPFLNLDQLKPGDAIVVQTGKSWFVYTVGGDAASGDLAATDADGVPGREIVSPNAVQVIAPVPDHPGVAATKAYLTLTTCHPKYTANQRMIIHASLTRTIAAHGSAIPRELGGTI